MECRPPRQCSDRRSPGVGQEGMGHPRLGDRTRPDQSIFGLKEHLQAGCDVICDQGRNPNPQIDQISRTKFESGASGDDGLRVHGECYPLEMRESTSGAGVMTRTVWLTTTGKIWSDLSAQA